MEGVVESSTRDSLEGPPTAATSSDLLEAALATQLDWKRGKPPNEEQDEDECSWEWFSRNPKMPRTVRVDVRDDAMAP